MILFSFKSMEFDTSWQHKSSCAWHPFVHHNHSLFSSFGNNNHLLRKILDNGPICHHNRCCNPILDFSCPYPGTFFQRKPSHHHLRYFHHIHSPSLPFDNSIHLGRRIQGSARSFLRIHLCRLQPHFPNLALGTACQHKFLSCHLLSVHHSHFPSCSSCNSIHLGHKNLDSNLSCHIDPNIFVLHFADLDFLKIHFCLEKILHITEKSY